ncbi:MAG: hypothetical protein A2571_03590 [Candidatus Vogelbacteria bacterium RIFOXYD1_FULL_44_32]|uniref:Uncharacterized protein n=1 Tax=Candidatus Vogelbacteria bacterium RIFOXYD1_FULL_44_32 TaxID=1802438 RepID=A0A1G2QBZ8_9BACT|nr:MAG: hypothetical protein A2571_03590 [Candidatus Vogelbacteria bacterium RIFOXYD1_FULL_44_32]
MTNNISRLLIKAGLIAVAVVVPTVTSFAYAATYAYVNQSGEVSTVNADNGMTAIAIAPNIATHSGVILLNSQADNEIVGDGVSGI